MNAVTDLVRSLQTQDLFFTFESKALPDAELVVRSFQADEAVSELAQIMVDLTSHNPAIDLRALIDTEVVLTVHDRYGDPRHFHGIVETAERGERGHHRTFYHITLMPALHRLRFSSDCRIFQDKSVPEIVEIILREHGIVDFEFQLKDKRREREYCTQYRETHYDFIARLLAEEGIFFYFRHTQDAHRLMMTDVPYSVPDVPFTPTLEHNATAGGHIKSPFVQSFRWRETVQPSAVWLRDHLFTHPCHTFDQDIKARQTNGLEGDYEMYDYPGRHKGEEGKAFARHRLENFRMNASQGYGKGRCPHLSAGHRFTLEDSQGSFPTGSSSPSSEGPPKNKYLVLNVTHYGEQPSALKEETPADSATGEGAATFIHTNFTVVSGNEPVRMPQKVKPMVDGPQMAVVTGPPNEEIHCDEWGRVKVQFPWDREAGPEEVGKAADKSSCWVRVAQGWSGARFGHMAIPRIGQHVIISHLEGDPDQPIITGRAYNGLNPPPYRLPEHKTRMTLKSKTHKGDGYNELRFEDQGGIEQVFIHAERDYDMIVKNDRREWIKHDRHLLVDNSLSEEIKKDHSSVVAENRIEGTGKTYSLSAGKDMSARVGEKCALQVGETFYIKAGSNIVIESDTEITLKGAGGFVRIDAGGVTVRGLAVNINSGGSPGTGTPAEILTPLKVDKADERSS